MRRKILIAELEKQLKPVMEKLSYFEDKIGQLEKEVKDCRLQINSLENGEETQFPELPCDEILLKLDYVISELKSTKTFLTNKRESGRYSEPDSEEAHEKYVEKNVLEAYSNNEPEFGGSGAESGEYAQDFSEVQTESTVKDEISDDGEADTKNVAFVKLEDETGEREKSEETEKKEENIKEFPGNDPFLADTKIFSNTSAYPFFAGREFTVVRDRKKPATVKFDKSAESRGIVRYADNKLVSIFSGSKILGEYYNLGKTRDISVISICGSEYYFPRSGDISEHAVLKLTVEDGVLCLYICTRVWGDIQKSFVYGNEQLVKLAKVEY